MKRVENIWAVSGAVPSAGRTTLAVNIAVWLALGGERVLVIDGGGGGAGRLMGVEPEATLCDFFTGHVSDISSIAVATWVPGLRMTLDGGAVLSPSGMDEKRRAELAALPEKLGADRIIVDAGIGQGPGLFDLFALSGLVVEVLLPGPLHVKKTYEMLKGYLLRRLNRLFGDDAEMAALIRRATDRNSSDRAANFIELTERMAALDSGKAELALKDIERFRPAVVVNMAASERDRESAEVLMEAAKTYLDIEVLFAGLIRKSEVVRSCASSRRPFVMDDSEDGVCSDMDAVMKVLLGASGIVKTGERRTPGVWPLFGFNDTVEHRGKIYHVQTEVVRNVWTNLDTVVFQDGMIYFSIRKKAVCPEEELRDAALKQHRTVIAALKADRLSGD